MLDSSSLKRIAKLAKIEINSEEENEILMLLNNDIVTVKSIDSINTDGLEPMISPSEINKLVLHNDEVTDGDKQEELMKCAPNSMYNYFIVPKVVE